VTVSVQADVAPGWAGADTGVTVNVSGLGPVAGATVIEAPCAQLTAVVRSDPAGFCAIVSCCGVGPVKLSVESDGVTPP